MILLSIILSVIAYAVGGMWTYGYLAGKDGRGEGRADYHSDHGLDYYKGIGTLFFWQSIIWLFVLAWSVPKPLIHAIAQCGYNRGVRDHKIVMRRVEIERRVRIQLDNEKREAEKEVEWLRREAEKETEEVLTKHSRCA